MTDARLLARRIVTALQSSRIGVSTEASAQKDAAEALTRAGLEVRREVGLSARDRIDLMVGAVGIEVKVKGSRREIFRQLERYAESDQIAALVLASSSAWPAGISTIGGKPFFHASLVRGWL